MVAHRLRSSHCLPLSLLKNIFDTTGPFIQTLINTSLVTGCVPSCFKQAIVQDPLKKHSLGPTFVANYRPILKLSFKRFRESGLLTVGGPS